MDATASGNRPRPTRSTVLAIAGVVVVLALMAGGGYWLGYSSGEDLGGRGSRGVP